MMRRNLNIWNETNWFWKLIWFILEKMGELYEELSLIK